jgi:FKBP-type peptidyl-prolyl cis-trans isomerase
MMKLNAWIVAATCILLIGCGKGDKTADSTTTTTTGSTPVATTTGTTTQPTKPALKSTLTALKITVVKVGDGTNQGIKIKSNPTVARDDIVSIQYTGKLADGTVFDTNVPGAKGHTDQPFVVEMGRTPVIAGWYQGLLGMKIGGERKLSIPPKLGYGAEGNQSIPPNADLFFDVKVLDIVKKGDEGTFDSTDVTKGSGPAVKPGGTVTIQYTGTFANGVVFDSNMGADKAPMAVKLGAGMVISGLESGLVGMQKGGVRKLRIPPAIAYGTKNVPGIPSNSTLFFTVKALDVSP